MTVPTHEPPEPLHASEPAGSPGAEPSRDAIAADLHPGRARSVSEVCPYLTASSGAWRTATPNRAHRCAAVDPPGPVTTEKQRRHCLSVDHANCQIFRAARANRAGVLAPGVDPSVVAAADAARRPMARTAPLILEQPRLTAPMARWPLDRALSQAALIGLMVVAFAVVVLVRFGAGGGAEPSPSPAASIAPSPTATATPTRRPTPSPSPSGSAEVSPSASAAVASPSPAPSFREYRVRAGDTLVGIADEFGTTVKALQELNGLTGSNLRIGQILKIP